MVRGSKSSEKLFYYYIDIKNPGVTRAILYLGFNFQYW